MPLCLSLRPRILQPQSCDLAGLLVDLALVELQLSHLVTPLYPSQRTRDVKELLLLLRLSQAFLAVILPVVFTASLGDLENY